MNNAEFLRMAKVSGQMDDELISLCEGISDSSMDLKSVHKNYYKITKDRLYGNLAFLIDLKIREYCSGSDDTGRRSGYAGELIVQNNLLMHYDYGLIHTFCGIQYIKESEHNWVIKQIQRYRDTTKVNLINVISILNEITVIPRGKKFVINKNYYIKAFKEGVFLINTQYGTDQLVELPMKIRHVYISFDEMIICDNRNKRKIRLPKQTYNEICNNITECSENVKIEETPVGNLLDGRMYIKVLFGRYKDE